MLSLWLYNYCSAAEITNSWLLLEYKFQSEIKDTSWNNKLTTYTWWTTLNNDSITNTNYITFSWWKINTNLWWSTDEYWKYTISLWYKWKPNWNQWIFWYLSWTWWLWVLWENTCQAFLQNFTCSILDWKWHNIILRKNWIYNKVYIDGKLLLDYKWLVWALPYNITLWIWWLIYGSPYYNYYVPILWNFYSSWSMMWFRLYNRELSLDEMTSLYQEYKYTQDSTVDVYEYTVSPLSSWASAYGTWNYTVTFDVSTLLSQRINNNNIIRAYYPGWENYPQTIFSTMTSNTNNLNINLTNNYLCSTPYGNFDCSVLKDEKNHTFLIRKNNLSFNVYIDWNKTFSISSTWSLWNIWDTISQWVSTFTIPWNTQHCPNRRTWYDPMWFNQNWVFICSWKNQFSWSINNLTVYNWFITDNQLTNWFIQKWYNKTTPTIWILKWYLNNLLTIDFSWSLAQDRIENTNYEYSFDNTNFIKINSWSIFKLDSTTWSFLYESIIDTSSQSDWTWSIYLRTNNWSWTITFISKMLFTKITSYDIIINEPNKNNETSKYMSASFSSWSLYMNVTRWTICNSAMTFETYSDMSFNSTKDNWTRICYKWINTTSWKEYYKLSNPIEWIVSWDTTNWKDLFDYYASWKYSPSIRKDDSTYMMLSLLLNSSQNWSITSTSTSLSSMVDINWDWLVDLLYLWQLNWIEKRAILINNWNLSFTTSYKCASSSSWYYWDCAWDLDTWY